MRAYLQLASHVLFAVVGEHGAALDAAKSRPFPNAASDKLEGTGADFLASGSHTNDAGLAPSLVASLLMRGWSGSVVEMLRFTNGYLQSAAHGVNVSNALKSVVEATIGHFYQNLLDWLVIVLRVDALGGAELLRQLKL